jgi:hypothetical protein
MMNFKYEWVIPIYFFCNMSLRVVVLGAENVGKSGKFGIKIDFYLILNLMENICTSLVQRVFY